MSLKPDISIIMPARNAANWVEACIKSILAQAGPTWELIVVDDHSIDQTNFILQRLSLQDARIRILNNEGDGIIDALNTALKEVRADFITRMDADDVMPQNKLQTLYDLVDQQSDVVATGKVEYFSDEPISEGYQSYEQWLNDRTVHGDHWQWVYRECTIASANWMTHKSNVRFERNVYPEDYNLVFEWYKKGLKVKSAIEVTHLWREHPERTSRNSEHYQQVSFFRLKMKWFERIDRNDHHKLVLLGRNQKSRLAERFLSDAQSSIEVLDETTIERLQNETAVQVLVAVYPNQKARMAIQGFLHNLGLEMGRDWWWI